MKPVIGCTRSRHLDERRTGTYLRAGPAIGRGGTRELQDSARRGEPCDDRPTHWETDISGDRGKGAPATCLSARETWFTSFANRQLDEVAISM